LEESTTKHSIDHDATTIYVAHVEEAEENTDDTTASSKNRIGERVGDLGLFEIVSGVIDDPRRSYMVSVQMIANA